MTSRFNPSGFSLWTSKQINLKKFCLLCGGLAAGFTYWILTLVMAKNSPEKQFQQFWIPIFHSFKPKLLVLWGKSYTGGTWFGAHSISWSEKLVSGQLVPKTWGSQYMFYNCWPARYILTIASPQQICSFKNSVVSVMCGPISRENYWNSTVLMSG